MKSSRTLRILFLLLPAWLFAVPTDAAYTVSRSVLGSGGGITQGGAAAIHGTAGQAAIGQTGVGSLLQWIGFWYAPNPSPSDVPHPGADLPLAFRLDQSRPNPGSGKILIPFALPRGSPVRLTLFDITGRRLGTLLDDERPAGFHVVPLDLSRLPAGIYFYEFRAGSFVEVRKLVVVD
jgi:hypothetical protein